jgi:inosine-uridine nucleoside N-ribohydrolase
MAKICSFLCCVFLALSTTGQPKKPVALIFDSDMGPDYDDVGAITLLHALADSGQVNILATIASTKYEGVAGVFNVLNTYFNRPSVPIGVPTGNALTDKDRQHWTDTLLARYPHAIQTNKEVPDAVALYRQILARQPDHSVTIVTVGFLTNLSHLLQSGPDQFSRLPGKELVRKKVTKLVSMAGGFPSGKEYNVFMDAVASQVVFSQWPTPVLLSGFEIGQKIKTGLPLVRNTAIRESPVQDAFRISMAFSPEDSAGRMSWDQTAVLVAIKGHAPFYKLRSGQMTVSDNGSNRWTDGEGAHAHLVENMAPAEVESLINRLMVHQPVKSKNRNRAGTLPGKKRL